MSVLKGKILQSNRPTLHEWQEEHVDVLTNAMRANGHALDGSDTGTGKTIMALEVCRRLGRIPFVVCPKAVIPSWTEWMKAFRPNDPTQFAYTYDKLRGGKTAFLHKKGKKIRWNLDKNVVVLIFDEVHRCKGDKTVNSKMLAMAKAEGIPTLMLSATVCSNPVEMKSIGYLLGLHDYKRWWNWCLRNGCKRGVFGGLVFNNSAKVLSDLHKHIYPNRGSRIRISELPEGSFPETLITADGYRIDESEDVNAIYKSMAEELARLEEVASDDEETPLTIQLRARQKAELLKVPAFVELARDALADGNSVAVFINFRATLDAVVNRLSIDTPIATVHGDQSTDERRESVEAFQSNESRIIVCMIQAGGVGLNLHDEHGGHPRVSLISPSFSAVELRQTLGRVHRAGGETASVQKIVFAADTVEMGVCRAVRRKLTNLDRINDDELNPIL